MIIKPCKLNIDSNRHESVIRGDALFPCGAYFADLNKTFTGDIPWHWHEEIEILFVINGTLSLHINQNSFILNEGDGAFINTNQLHFAKIAKGSNCILKSFVFNLSFISGSNESVYNQKYMKLLINSSNLEFLLFLKNNKRYLEIYDSFIKAFDEYEKESFGFEFIVREKLSFILLHIIKDNFELLKKPCFKKNLDIKRIKKMLEFIHLNYNSSINLKDISSSAHISSRECLRCFKNTLNITPLQYLIQYRVSIAANLITSTNLPITEICMNVGFENPSYFSKTFKKLMSYSPSSYRTKSKINNF